jgi:hypothetical protein
MSYMHEGEPYGHLTIDGMQPNAAAIASLVGRPAGEVLKAMVELEARRVFSRAESGAIFSRRMVRDKAKAETDRENGKAGGNPKLTNQVNFGVNPPDKAHMLEAREGRKEDAAPPLVSLPLSEASSFGGSTEALPRVASGVPRWPRNFRDQFWAKFPNKVGKESALKKLERLEKSGRVTFDEFMAGLDRYVQKTDDRPWCNPETWINQGRWSDEPAAQPQRVNGQAAPRPGSREDNRERTHHALQKLRNFVASNADDAGRSRRDGQPDAGFLPLVEPPRS